jgi:plasmid stabilization system protein ParE
MASGTTSIRLPEDVLRALDALIEFPYIGHLGEVPGTRVRNVTGQLYVVVYRATEETVEILHVYHERQDWRRRSGLYFSMDPIIAKVRR